MVNAGKRIENRLAWKSCDYRGPFFLHASKWPAGDAEKLCAKPPAAMGEFYATTRDMVDRMERSFPPSIKSCTIRDLLEHRGGVIGHGKIVGVISGPLDFQSQVRARMISASQEPWYMGGFALVVEDVRPLPFIECSGALGFFGLETSAYERAVAALAEAA